MQAENILDFLQSRDDLQQVTTNFQSDFQIRKIRFMLNDRKINKADKLQYLDNI